MSNEDFYSLFENKFRLSRDFIKTRLNKYLPFFSPFREVFSGNCKTLDIGCGRGELVELLIENGFDAYGVDIDAGMLNLCKEFNLPVIQRDAISELQALESSSLTLVSGIQIAEHLPLDVLEGIINESLRVLRPGGILLLETPNPENIKVASHNFYIDPTHARLIPSELLSFLTDYYGFYRTKVVFLNESPYLLDPKNEVALYNVITGVSPDYAVIAQKKADPETLSVFDDVFAGEYGISFESLCRRYEKRIATISNRADETILKFTTMEQRLLEVEQRQSMTERKLLEAEQELSKRAVCLNILPFKLLLKAKKYWQ